MSDTIKWSELTPTQRDAIIHEKIFGLQVEPCQQPDDDEITLSCSACGHRYPDSLVEWTDPQEVPYIPSKQKAHTRPIPAYTSSLDAAWQLVERVTRPPQSQEEALQFRSTRFMFWFEKANLWACTREEAANELCLAALRACGVEVENE